MMWFARTRTDGSRGYDALAKEIVRPCVLWKGKRDRQGYGRTHFLMPDGRVEYRAHRVVFFKANGFLPQDCVLKRLCGNLLCVELSHMILGLPSSNALEKVANAKRWYRLSPSEISRLRAKLKS